MRINILLPFRDTTVVQVKPACPHLLPFLRAELYPHQKTPPHTHTCTNEMHSLNYVMELLGWKGPTNTLPRTRILFFFFNFYLLFIYYVYFWLCWVFVSV